MSGQRVLLINPPLGGYYRKLRVRGAISASPPLNLATLAGALLRHGHAVRIVDLASRPDYERSLGRLVESLRPDLVGITVRTPLLPGALRIARRLRRLLPGLRLVAGGPHPTSRPMDLLEGPFHAVVLGEGEAALCELAAGKQPGEVPGVAYLDASERVHVSRRPRLANVDALPFPAWHLFELEDYRRRSLVASHPPVADLESSRGCTAACVYCTHAVHGRRFRPKSAERFVGDIEQAASAGFRSFNLVDDNFTADLDRAKAICETMIRRGIRVPWTLTNGIRVSDCDRDFFALAARSGLRLVAFGLESGAQRLLDLAGKGTRLEHARSAVAAARAAGITTLGYFMVGLPGETPDTLAATVAFAKELDLDFAKFSITLPLPGTKLYEAWRPFVNEARLSDLNIHRENRSWLTHPTCRWSELEAFLSAAYRAFYFRPDYLLKRCVRDVKRGDLFFDLATAVATRW